MEREDRIGEVERELAGEHGRDEAELAELRVMLDRLRQLRRRIGEGRLEAADRALLLALIEQEMLERM
jgi:hypothetical protein